MIRFKEYPKKTYPWDTGGSTGETKGSNAIGSNNDTDILSSQVADSVKSIDTVGLTTENRAVLGDLETRDLAGQLEILSLLDVLADRGIQSSSVGQDNETAGASD